MKRYGLFAGLAVTILLFIAACGADTASTPTAAAVSTATPKPADTTAAAPTELLAPTATTAPTATLAPTATPPPTPLGKKSITIGPSKDNTLYETFANFTSNGAGQYFFAGRTNSGAARRGLIAFDVGGSIPAGATINSVTLTLNMSQTAAGEQNVQLHRLLSAWSEGNSDASENEGGGTFAATGDATWVHTSFDNAKWQSPGGDFSPQSSAKQQVRGVGQYIWGSTDEMVADVQGWLKNPATNFGWLLLGNEGANQTTKRFYSKENPTAANRPQLTVEFTSGGSAGPGGG